MKFIPERTCVAFKEKDAVFFLCFISLTLRILTDTDIHVCRVLIQIYWTQILNSLRLAWTDKKYLGLPNSSQCQNIKNGCFLGISRMTYVCSVSDDTDETFHHKLALMDLLLSYSVLDVIVIMFVLIIKIKRTPCHLFFFLPSSFFSSTRKQTLEAVNGRRVYVCAPGCACVCVSVCFHTRV